MICLTPSSNVMVSDLNLSLMDTPTVFLINFHLCHCNSSFIRLLQCPSLTSKCYHWYCECVVHLQSCFLMQLITPDRSVDRSGDSEEVCDFSTYIYFSLMRNFVSEVQWCFCYLLFYSSPRRVLSFESHRFSALGVSLYRTILMLLWAGILFCAGHLDLTQFQQIKKTVLHVFSNFFCKTWFFSWTASLQVPMLWSQIWTYLLWIFPPFFS